jgi:APA family basic amino acid/polyamine antiporter
MSRDRLLPGWLSSVHPRFGTPWVISLITGVVVAAIATFVPLSTLADMVNLGTLTWWRFLVWMALGLVVYFLHGYRNSRLARGQDRPPARR